MRFAAVVPAAPALPATLTGGPVADLEPVRRATSSALERLLPLVTDGTRPLVVLAPGRATRRLRPGLVTGLDGFGVELDGHGPGQTAGGQTAGGVLAPGAALALRLLAEAGVAVPPERLVLQEVDTDEVVAHCLRL